MTTIISQVSAKYDDGFQRPDGSINRGGHLGVVTGSASYALCRFQNVNVPKNAIIDNAWMTFNVLAGYTSPNMDIHFQNIDNAPEIDGASNNISSRTRTSTKTQWTASIGTGSVTSPNIAAPLQTVVNRAGWAAGQSLAAIMVDRGSSNFSSYSYDTGTGATLTVVYHMAGDPAPDPELPSPPGYLIRGRGVMRLAIQVYANSDMADMLSDFSLNAEGVRFATNPNGFSVLTIRRVRMSLAEAFTCYTWPGTPHIVVTAIDSGVVWEGRVEDVGIVPGGLTLTAFGYQNAMRDLLYTGFWMKLGTSDWRSVTSEERPAARPEQYEMDNNNRLYIAPRKGETYSGSVSNFGECTYVVPDKGDEPIRRIYASYDIRLPAGWTARLMVGQYDVTASLTDEATVTATGSQQTGTWSFNLTKERPRLVFVVGNQSGSDTTITADTGYYYAKLTNLGVRSTTYVTPRPPVAASDIVAALVDYVSTINDKQLSGETAWIGETTTVMQDANYEDRRPADILSELALQHGYQWSVWEDRVLSFAPVPTVDTLGVQTWVVDAESDMNIQRSLGNVYTNVYVAYDSQNDGTLRTDEAENSDTRAAIQLKRVRALSVDTQDATQAGAFRDAALGDWSQQRGRVQIRFNRVFDSGGGQAQLYQMRSGDIVTIRNLPPTLADNVDALRTFVIGETIYDVDAGRMDISPAVVVPVLDKMIARREAGLRR